MEELMEQKETKTFRRRELKGYVVSDSMQKTIVVAVRTKKRHRLYEKIVTTTKKYLAHDEKGEARNGDFVVIQECRPLSKRKRWKLLKIVEKAR